MSGAPQSSRRGFLGLFAAAPMVAAVAVAPAAPAAQAALPTPLTGDRKIALARKNIASKETYMATRPVIRPESPASLNLSHPACDHGCSPCLMACAILPERLDWWRAELVRLEAEGARS